MILLIIGVIIIIIIIIIPNTNGGNIRYTLTPYKCVTLPTYMNKNTINNKWTNDELPVFVLNHKKINITMAELVVVADNKKLSAEIFEPPASCIAPCFYDKETLTKYCNILPKTKFKGFWSFCGNDGGNLSQLCFLMKDYKLVSSFHKKKPFMAYTRSLAKTIGYGMNQDLDRVAATVKNILAMETKQYLQKDNLPKIFDKSGIFADTYDLDDFLNQDLKGVWLAKPVNGFGGMGIVISDKKEDIQAIQTTENKKPANVKKTKYIVCKYIENPLLLGGKKAHIRVLFMIGKRNQDGIIVNEFSIFPVAKIATAKLSYTFSDFKNKSIHDSHNSSTDICAIYNGDYFVVEGNPVKFDNRYQDGDTKIPLILENAWKSNKIREAIHKIMDIIKSRIDYDKFTKYPDSENAYKVYAPDIMLDENYNPYLLEINNMPGNISVLEYRNYNRQLFNWEMNAFVFPILKNIRLVKNDMFEGDKKIGSFSFTQENGKLWFSITVSTPRMGYGSMLLHRLENTKYSELKACYAKVPKSNREAIRFFQKYFLLLEKGEEYIFKY